MKIISIVTFLFFLLINALELKSQPDSTLYPLGEKNDFRGIEFRTERKLFSKKLIKCNWNGRKDLFDECVENDGMKIGNYNVSGIYYHFHPFNGKNAFSEVMILLPKQNIEGIFKYIASQYGEVNKKDWSEAYLWKGKYISISLSKWEGGSFILVFDNLIHYTEIEVMKQALKTQDSIFEQFRILKKKDSLDIIKTNAQNGF